MAVTTTSIGSNSKRIDIDSETSPNNILDAIDTAIGALGWTLYDTVSSGSRNTRVTKVYTAPNNDGASPTTKYMILRFDFLNFKFYMTCCESWNTETHVATNESWHGDRNFPFPLHYSKTSIYIFATARYCLIQCSFRDDLSIWQGIFEVERGEMPDDDAINGSPCFGYTNALIFGVPYGDMPNADSSKVFMNFWFPRTKDGYTGFRATRRHSISTPTATVPPPHFIISFANTTFTNDNSGLSYGLNTMTSNSNIARYNANTTHRLLVEPKLTSISNAYHETGRIYGMKLANNFCDQLDYVSLPINNNYFYSTSGSNNNHYAFLLGGGNPLQTAPLAMGVTRQSFSNTFKAAFSSANVTFHESVLVQGRYMYLASNTSVILKWDMDTNTTSNINISAVCFDLVHDGGTNLYGATNTGIIRIQTANSDFVSTVTGGGNATVTGYSVVIADDDNVYAGSRTYQITNQHKLDVYSLSSFTLANTANALASIISSFSYMILGDAEHAGFVYCGIGYEPVSGTHGAAIFKYQSNTNTFVANGSYTTSALVGSAASIGGIAYYNGEGIVVMPSSVYVSAPLGRFRASLHSMANVQNLTGNNAANTSFITTANATVTTATHSFKFPKTATFMGMRYAKSSVVQSNNIHMLRGTNYANNDGATLNGATGDSNYILQAQSAISNTSFFNQVGDTLATAMYSGPLHDDGVNFYYFGNPASTTVSCWPQKNTYRLISKGIRPGVASSGWNIGNLPVIFIPS